MRGTPTPCAQCVLTPCPPPPVPTVVQAARRAAVRHLLQGRPGAGGGRGLREGRGCRVSGTGREGAWGQGGEGRGGRGMKCRSRVMNGTDGGVPVRGHWRGPGGCCMGRSGFGTDMCGGAHRARSTQTGSGAHGNTNTWRTLGTQWAWEWLQGWVAWGAGWSGDGGGAVQGQ